MNVIFAIVILFPLALYSVLKPLVMFFIPRAFKSKKDLKGEKILITGAGSGLGRQLAIEFSKHSVCLVLLDINKKSLKETEQSLKCQSSVFSYYCDVSDRKMVYEVADKIKKEIGDIDIIVNNAGIVSGKYLLELPDETIVKTMEVNALAHFWVVKSFLPAMIRKNKGHIVSITSIMGKSVVPRLTDYCASKYAAVGFAESLEIELRARKIDGIKITIICPSHIDTGLFEGANVGFASVMTPEYVANEVEMAVLEEKEIIFLPHIFNILVRLSSLVPRWMTLKFCETTGSIKVMENFTGKITVKGNDLFNKERKNMDVTN